MQADLSGLRYGSTLRYMGSDCNCHVFLCPDNGMHIAWIPHLQGNKMVVKRLMESGSQLERSEQLGGAHALEHFFYKDGAGFKRFLGADINAWTTMLARDAGTPT